MLSPMLSPKRLLSSVLAVGFFACSFVIVHAQEFRGSISGRVTEATGASVPGAQVTITNIATNTSTTMTTNAEGNYNALYLNAGQYLVTVEAKGFRKMVRQGVEVRVGDKLELNLALEVGRVSEAVTVTADAPLLESSTASAGQVIDQRRIADLPLSDGNPFVLSRLSPGIAYVGDLKFSRPFDNSGAAAVIADGAPGKNEFTLDGTPNMAGTGGTNGAGRVAFVPPADAVQEFKIETASYDGQQSHTAAATVNVILKNGTNGLHGSVYEFVRNDILSGNDFFLNRAGTPRPALHYNRYGFTVGGPVWTPKKVFGPLSYDGRNRSFFFFSLEKLKDVFPEPGLFTVPTQAERNGDFSALLPSIVIYNPASAVAAGARVQRTAFPGNIIPANLISDIAKNYLKFYPLPNLPGDSQGRQNFISPQPRFDTFHSESYRFDQTLSDKQRFFVRYTHNWRRENRSNWTGAINGITPTGNFLFRINNGGAFDHLYNFSPTVVLNTRVGFSRFNEANVRQHQGVFDPASLGFPAATAALFGPEKYLPQFDIANFSTLGNTVGDGSTYNIYSFQPTLTKIAGKHSFRVGYDFRSYRENAFNAGHAAGNYTFSNAFTKGPLDNSAGGAIGQELASFLLGRTTGGSIDRNTARANQTLYHGMFVHDDWKLSSKLTLNLGLRYEYEGATNERYNRNIFSFDQTASSPIEAAAKAAYAVSPIPEIAASSFNVKGGLLFADGSHRSFWDADKNNIQPRIGFAYKLTDKTVLRGGWGIYTVPFIIDGVRQSGFSQSTPIAGSNDNGLTFLSSLANPFPNGVLAPAGASLGLSALLGQGVTFLPRDYHNSQTQRWSLGAQRELPGNWLAEVQYVGNHGYSLVVGTNILNAIPRKYLSTATSAIRARLTRTAS